MKKEDREHLPERIVTVKVQPRSKSCEVIKISEKEYKVKVFAPPVKGAANKEVIEALSSHFGIPRAGIRIIRGEKSSRKRVLISP